MRKALLSVFFTNFAASLRGSAGILGVNQDVKLNASRPFSEQNQ